MHPDNILYKNEFVYFFLLILEVIQQLHSQIKGSSIRSNK